MPVAFQAPAPAAWGLNRTYPVGYAGPPDVATDPMAAYRYLDAKRQATVASYHQRPLIRLWDQDHKYIGTLASEMSGKVEELYADTGSANFVIRKDNWLSNFLLYDRLVESDLQITVDPIPTQQDWPLRWGGKVTALNAKRDSKGLHTVEFTCAHNREHLKHLLALCNPTSPPELQIPKMWILPLNCRSALTISLAFNLARQFEPFMSIPDNIMNPTSWLGTRAGDINPNGWPIQPQWLNVFTDQSRFEVFAAHATDFHTASASILEDAGCIWKAYTYLTTDPTSPNPELAGLGNPFGNLPNQLLGEVPIIGGELQAALGEITGVADGLLNMLPFGIGTAIEDIGPNIAKIIDTMSRPTRNAIILAAEDKSGVSGLTGTAADGAISFIASTADDLITDVLIPQYDPSGNGETAPLIQSWFGAAPKVPIITFYDGEYSAIIESNRIQHASTATTYELGGKSPGWVNDLITFGIKYMLSQISDVIPTPIFAYQQPGSPGLDELYQEELSDTVLAYQRFSDPTLELYAGEMSYKESFNSASSTAWTVSGILGLRDEQWKNRAYTSFNTSVRIFGSQWLPFLDYVLGDRVNWQMANTLYTDQVAGMRYMWDVSTPVNWEIAVGTNTNEMDPVSKALRGLAGIWNLFGMAMGSTQLF